jgi:ribosomal protein S18 acetylase RimI-like enzyme
MLRADIEIITLPAVGWQAYRRLRLEALRESPQAFSTTYQEQVVKPDNYWQGRLEDAARGEQTWLLFARSGQDLLGMIGAYRENRDESQDDHRLATIISVYVTPPARGRGISRLLMEAILDRLKQAGFHKVQLGVMSDQAAAVHLYQSFGFVTVKTEHNRMGDGLQHEEVWMERDI